ncbi:hypothetical protein [Bacillus sp. Cr_A10]|uniref:hypothetical protein n=1 Tax=Bacillus sp. Cr_A10 TaxID=3033993 RepID=UPI0023D9CB89|nr:hypothetical protein [Bacillus sp. Cr_A10]MDF2066779.1 hypothetical protein [Bacillus sp. Cr_A10]
MLIIIIFIIVVISFYVISIWQYINPTKAIRLWHQPAYKEDPKVYEAFVRRSIITSGIFFTLAFIVIIVMTVVI